MRPTCKCPVWLLELASTSSPTMKESLRGLVLQSEPQATGTRMFSLFQGDHPRAVMIPAGSSGSQGSQPPSNLLRIAVETSFLKGSYGDLLLKTRPSSWILAGLHLTSAMFMPCVVDNSSASCRRGFGRWGLGWP